MLHFLSHFLIYGIHLTPYLYRATLKTDSSVKAVGGISIFVLLIDDFKNLVGPA